MGSAEQFGPSRSHDDLTNITVPSGWSEKYLEKVPLEEPEDPKVALDARIGQLARQIAEYGHLVDATTDPDSVHVMRIYKDQLEEEHHRLVRVRQELR